jgi:hypothetical protein
MAGASAMLSPAHAMAQKLAGTELENGQIVVKIYVTMNQTGIPTGRPISDYTIVVVAPSGERSSVTTGDAGTTELRLLPGVYRVVSLKPLLWYDHHYMWDLALNVRRGMRVLDLTPTNAVRNAADTREQVVAPPPTAPAPAVAPAQARVAPFPASAVAAPVPAQPPRVEGSSTTPPAYLYKSPGEAVLFSFLITGAGQMYNGQVGKGVGLLLLGAGSLVVGAANSAERCNQYGCVRSTAPLAIGAGVFLGTWIYSMVDAYSTAKQHNAKMGFRVGAIPVSPHFGAGSNGRTMIGLSLAVR